MRKKVLIVDDSETIRTLEGAALAQDYDVLSASDGSEALEIAIRETPDIIIMDVLMPRMNGIEACRALREHAETRDIPVLMVTTDEREDSIHQARLAGCVDYVLKPIVAAELAARVRALLGEADPWQMRATSRR